MKFYFYIGLLIITATEILLFAGFKWVRIFFTPLIWTGYILFIDAIVFRIKGKSWISGRGKTFLLMIPLSAAFWFIFEFFNLFLDNWIYVGLPTFWITAIGMTWAFATIGPGILETSELLESIGAFKLKTRKFEVPKSLLYILMIIGGGCLISILVTPPRIARYLSFLLWIGFILLLDPMNYIKGQKSILMQWQTGNFQNFLCLFVSGFICGFLWEFWNFWAVTKWVYQLPYAIGPKIFEMPLLGFLGFPALALEYYVFYSFVLQWKE